MSVQSLSKERPNSWSQQHHCCVQPPWVRWPRSESLHSLPQVLTLPEGPQPPNSQSQHTDLVQQTGLLLSTAIHQHLHWGRRLLDVTFLSSQGVNGRLFQKAWGSRGEKPSLLFFFFFFLKAVKQMVERETDKQEIYTVIVGYLSSNPSYCW